MAAPAAGAAARAPAGAAALERARRGRAPRELEREQPLRRCRLPRRRLLGAGASDCGEVATARRSCMSYGRGTPIEVLSKCTPSKSTSFHDSVLSPSDE